VLVTGIQKKEKKLNNQQQKTIKNYYFGCGVLLYVQDAYFNVNAPIWTT